MRFHSSSFDAQNSDAYEKLGPMTLFPRLLAKDGTEERVGRGHHGTSDALLAAYLLLTCCLPNGTAIQRKLTLLACMHERLVVANHWNKSPCTESHTRHLRSVSIEAGYDINSSLP